MRPWERPEPEQEAIERTVACLFRLALRDPDGVCRDEPGPLPGKPLGPKARATAEPLAARALALLLVFACAVLVSGCSVKKFAINKIGDSLAKSSSSTFASDDDPDLVGEALPFGLKLMEGLLAKSPKHRGLLFATSSGFAQYAYVYVQQPAEEMEEHNLAKAAALRMRARRLYLRARGYGLRGLEMRHRGFEQALRADPKAAVRVANKKDVPLLYWTAAAWGLAISISKDDPEMIADQPVVEALIDRALELDPDYEHGAIHGFLISYEAARKGVPGDFAVRSRKHFERTVELTGGQMVGPYVALAETVAVQKQDREEFERLLRRALAIDSNARPEWRLANLVMQKRARWLLARADDLFVK